MATLTYDPTPADNPEFSDEEQDSIRVGQELAEQQENLLAGKFKDAEDLEKAYLELQKKLGTNDGTQDEALRDEAGNEERSEEEVNQYTADGSVNWEQVDETYGDIIGGKFKENGVDPWEISKDFYERGEMTEENYKTLEGIGFSRQMVDTYLTGAMSEGSPQATEPVSDLSDAQVMTIKQDVGGEQEFNNILQWAADNLDSSYIKSYDNLVETGNFESIQLAVAGLKSAYDNANGYEGRMLTGKAAPVTQDVFRSQAEVVAAMGDPRYDKDPAYRQDVFAKLERSNINF
jgi:hypothetical protein